MPLAICVTIDHCLRKGSGNVRSGSRITFPSLQLLAHCANNKEIYRRRNYIRRDSEREKGKERKAREGERREIQV